MGELNAVVEDILFGMRKVRPHFRKLFSYATDMSDAEILILSLLISEPDGKMLLSNLQQQLLPIRPSKLTNITNKLEDKGYIKKQRMKRDRRRVVIAITPKGKAAYEKFENVVREAIERNVDKVSPEELDVLRKSFDVWCKLLEDI